MNLGMPEMIFIFLLALVIFGPRKLPELGRQLGKALGEFKKASNEFKSQLETEMLNIELEERSKQAPPPDESPKILPAEKLFDTVSGPPGQPVPRGSLSAPEGTATVEPETHAPTSEPVVETETHAVAAVAAAEDAKPPEAPQTNA
jgi:TatA/E family protein of Tat protein translocase